MFNWLGKNNLGTDEGKLEAISSYLSRITGSNIIGGTDSPAGDENVLRFDFENDVNSSIVEKMNEHGLEAKSFQNSLWVWRDK